MHNHKLYGEPPKCPQCAKLQDGAFGPQHEPKNGDFCVCFYCGAISIFKIVNNNFTLNVADKEDFKTVPSNVLDQIIAAKAFVETQIQFRNGKQ